MAREDHDNPTSRLAAELQAEVAKAGRSRRPARPSNPELVDAFRALLTSGCPAELREATKAWRAELWRAFAELDRRLCPTRYPGPATDARNDDGE